MRHTGVVDQSINVIVLGAHSFESSVDGLIACEINLEQLQGGSAVWEFGLDLLNGSLALVNRVAAENNVIRSSRAQKCSDILQPDPCVRTSDEDDGPVGRHVGMCVEIRRWLCCEYCDCRMMARYAKL